MGLFFSEAKKKSVCILPTPTYKIKGRFEQKIMIKVIIALVVLNIYPSGYSLFFYAWCSSYPSVHNRSSQSLLA